MESKVYTFSGERITVTWDQKRCIHAEACIHGLPDVFDPERRPWIDPDEAEAKEVAAAVQQCPTGALHNERGEVETEEPTPPTNTITLGPDGPLYLRGDIKVVNTDGAVLLDDTRIALCRCGLSENKPLCDGSHANRFQDAGTLKDTSPLSAADSMETSQLRVKPSPDGPLLVEGPVDVQGNDGTAASGGRAAFCRCGASGNKPFCDGSHADIGFEAA